MTGTSWSPGIGDPTLGSWITVAAYLLAATLALSARRKSLLSGDADNAPFWLGLCVFLLLFGLNKQLDLQSLLTEVGRDLAKSEGWFDFRRTVQLAFLTSVATVGLFAFAIVAKRFWRRRASVKLAVIGLFVQVLFIIIRAASFHHLDLFMDGTILGLRWNLLLELLGISMMGFGAAIGHIEGRSHHVGASNG